MINTVNDPVALRPESVEHYAKVLGKSAVSHAIFNAIYSYKDKPQTIEEVIERSGLKKTPKQTVRNRLNKFAGKHLISHEPSGGRTLYGKYKHVMGMKDDILRHPAAGGRKRDVETIRRPKVAAAITVVAPRSASWRQKKIRILYLSATPESQSLIRPDAEYRLVHDHVRRSALRDRIQLEHRPAADLQALLQGMNDLRPEIVHFSGHAGDDGLWLDDGQIVRSVGSLLPYRRLAEVISATAQPPRVVILNACRTANAANALVSTVDAVVTMRRSVSDLGAGNFASQLYSAIASGQPIEKAFRQAKALMEQVNGADANIAKIAYKAGVNGNKLILLPG